MKLHWKIIISMILGVGVGFIYNTSANQDGTLYDLILLLGDIFIRLLEMIIVPLVVSSLIVGVMSLGSVQSLGRLGAHTFIYYLITTWWF